MQLDVDRHSNSFLQKSFEPINVSLRTTGDVLNQIDRSFDSESINSEQPLQLHRTVPKTISLFQLQLNSAASLFLFAVKIGSANSK